MGDQPQSPVSNPQTDNQKDTPNGTSLNNDANREPNAVVEGAESQHQVDHSSKESKITNDENGSNLDAIEVKIENELSESNESKNEANDTIPPSTSNPINHKTPCKFYTQSGTCKYGFNCRYSHGFPQAYQIHQFKNGTELRAAKLTNSNNSSTMIPPQQKNQKTKKYIMKGLRILLMAHSYAQLGRPIAPDDKLDIATHCITKAVDLSKMLCLLQPDSWKELINLSKDVSLKYKLSMEMNDAIAQSQLKVGQVHIRRMDPGLWFEDDNVEMILQVQVDKPEYVHYVPKKVEKYRAVGFVLKKSENERYELSKNIARKNYNNEKKIWSQQEKNENRIHKEVNASKQNEQHSLEKQANRFTTKHKGAHSTHNNQGNYEKNAHGKEIQNLKPTKETEKMNPTKNTSHTKSIHSKENHIKGNRASNQNKEGRKFTKHVTKSAPPTKQDNDKGSKDVKVVIANKLQKDEKSCPTKEANEVKSKVPKNTKNLKDAQTIADINESKEPRKLNYAEVVGL